MSLYFNRDGEMFGRWLELLDVDKVSMKILLIKVVFKVVSFEFLGFVDV